MATNTAYDKGGVYEGLSYEEATKKLMEDAQSLKTPTVTTQPVAPENIAIPDYAPAEETQPDYYADLIKTQQDMAAQTLQAERDAKLRALNIQSEDIPEQYKSQRAKINVSALMGKKSLKDFLATRGLTKSGAASQGEIAQNVSQQGLLGQSLSEEQQAQEDIARQRAEVQAGYSSGIAQSQLQGQQQAQQYAYEDYVNQQNQATTDAANLLKTEIATIDRYANDYQAEIDRRTAINPNDPLIPYLQSARVQKISGMEQADMEYQMQLQIAQQKAYQEGNEQAYDNAWDRFVKTGQVSTQSDANILGMPVGTTTLEYQRLLGTQAEEDTPPTKNEVDANIIEAINTGVGATMLEQLQSQQVEIIKQYGLNTYNNWVQMLIEAIKNKRLEDVGGTLGIENALIQE